MLREIDWRGREIGDALVLALRCDNSRNEPDDSEPDLLDAGPLDLGAVRQQVDRSSPSSSSEQEPPGIDCGLELSFRHCEHSLVVLSLDHVRSTKLSLLFQIQMIDSIDWIDHECLDWVVCVCMFALDRQRLVVQWCVRQSSLCLCLSLSPSCVCVCDPASD